MFNRLVVNGTAAEGTAWYFGISIPSRNQFVQNEPLVKRNVSTTNTGIQYSEEKFYFE
jgi:hypothetical protein